MKTGICQSKDRNLTLFHVVWSLPAKVFLTVTLRDQLKLRDYMDWRVTPPKRVTSPTWGPSPPCKLALKKFGRRFAWTVQSVMIVFFKDKFKRFVQDSQKFHIYPSSIKQRCDFNSCFLYAKKAKYLNSDLKKRNYDVWKIQRKASLKKNARSSQFWNELFSKVWRYLESRSLCLFSTRVVYWLVKKNSFGHCWFRSTRVR